MLPSIPRDDLEDLIEECISLTAPSCNDGWSVYDQRTGKGKEKESKKVVWGLSKLDGIIDEWDWIGIVELSGPRRVGKSVSSRPDDQLRVATRVTCCFEDPSS